MSERKRILVADTEELNLDFFELMLTKIGYDVEKTDDGQAALDKIKQKHFDLALINTILPKVSGWEILKMVKADARLAALQIMLLSDIDNIKEKVECYAHNGEDYVVKPFNFSVLVAKIGSVLRNKELYYELGRQSKQKGSKNDR